MVFLWNAWVIPYRSVFYLLENESTKSSNSLWIWLVFDYLGDAIYLLDLLFYKHRVLYMENGFWVKDKRRLTQHYIKEGTFHFDWMAIIPTDMLYLWLGIEATYVRFPRIIKVIAFWEFIDRLDRLVSKPYFLRLVKTVIYMLYLIHLNACAYYFISWYEGIGVNKFVYNGEGNAYIRCFYFATKTATSIGKNKRPAHNNNLELAFMTCSWLLGVLFFAILIGDIRDIVGNARLNQVIFYLSNHIRFILTNECKN